jgi:hypothetical protein
MVIQHRNIYFKQKMFNVKSCLFMQSKKWNSYQNHVKEPKNSKKVKRYKQKVDKRKQMGKRGKMEAKNAQNRVKSG